MTLMLAENNAEITPFFTESGVHHLAFRLQSQDLNVPDFATAQALYLDEYSPVPFQYQEAEAKQ